LVPWHNFELLLESFARLHAEDPARALLIVGDGPMRGAIEAQARALGVAGAARLTGPVPHHQAQRPIAPAAVAVIPQSNEYRSPIKLFEYMAQGKPVVAPRVPPIEAVLRHDRNGLLFAPGDADALCAALRQVLQHRPLARCLGARARRDVVRCF